MEPKDINHKNITRWRFIKPDWRITAATLVFSALTIAAGQWQQGRAAYKEALQQRYDERSAAPAAELSDGPLDAEDFDQRPVRVRGTYESKYSILIDNKVHRGRAGYHVLTPLKIGNTDAYVLVNRGWIAQGRTREELPRVPMPQGAQEIEGIAVLPSTRFLELKNAAEGKGEGPVWQNLQLARYGEWSGLRVQPIVIEQTNDAKDGLLREWPRSDFGIEKHRIYAMQWYSFCILTVLLYVFFHFKRIPRAG